MRRPGGRPHESGAGLRCGEHAARIGGRDAAARRRRLARSRGGGRPGERTLYVVAQHAAAECHCADTRRLGRSCGSRRREDEAAGRLRPRAFQGRTVARAGILHARLPGPDRLGRTLARGVGCGRTARTVAPGIRGVAGGCRRHVPLRRAAQGGDGHPHESAARRSGRPARRGDARCADVRIHPRGQHGCGVARRVASGERPAVRRFGGGPHGPRGRARSLSAGRVDRAERRGDGRRDGRGPHVRHRKAALRGAESVGNPRRGADEAPHGKPARRGDPPYCGHRDALGRDTRRTERRRGPERPRGQRPAERLPGLPAQGCSAAGAALRALGAARPQ